MNRLPKGLLFLIFLGTMAWFQACMVGPNFNASRTEIDSTAVYRYDSLQLAMTDSVLNIKWWELFQDPIIDTLINIGLRENKDVLIASSRIEQARAALSKTKAEVWPSFGYSAGALRGNVIQGSSHWKYFKPFYGIWHTELGNRFLGEIQEGQ